MSGYQPELDASFIERQRLRLEALRRQLAGAEHAYHRMLRAGGGREAREREDDAQELAEREVDVAVNRVDERRLRAVERALSKIAEGIYGLSDANGMPIPKDRLEAVPEAILTVHEKDDAERRQR